MRRDFSANSIGTVLEQVQDGQKRFITAIGRKTAAREKNYAPKKLELVTIIYALRKWEHILCYKPFQLFTDHQALKWLNTMKSPCGINFCWLSELSTFNYEIRSCPRKNMGCADGLSSSPHMDEPTWEEEEEGEEFIGSVRNIHDAQMNLQRIRVAQEEDDVLKKVRKWVKGSPPTKQYSRGAMRTTTPTTSSSSLCTSSRAACSC